MGAQSTNQHLTVFVSTYVNAVGAGSAVSVPTVDSVNFLPGMTTFVNKATGACTVAAPGGGVVYRIAHKNSAGDVFFSGDLVGNTKVQNYQAPVMPVQTITPVVGIAGDNYVVKLNVPNYGGLLSNQDDVNFYGNYTMVEGDTATEIATALVASLQAAVNKQSVPMVAITGTATIVATGLPQPYEQAKFSGRIPQFNLEMAQPEVAWAAADPIVPGSAGFGDGKRVAEQEEFYAGYNTGYKNRFADWPTMTNPTLDADPSHTYAGETIVGRGEQLTGTPNETVQRQTVICYYDLDGTALPA